MKLILTGFTFLLLLSGTVLAQLDKGVWPVGGAGNFLSSKNSHTSTNYNSTSDRIDLKI